MHAQYSDCVVSANTDMSNTTTGINIFAVRGNVLSLWCPVPHADKNTRTEEFLSSLLSKMNWLKSGTFTGWKLREWIINAIDTVPVIGQRLNDYKGSDHRKKKNA